MKKVKVLIVDDSALVRQTLYDILSSDPRIEVISTASDPFIAAEKINEQVPDVITLDVEMPRMDGLTFLKKIMAQHPIPVVICSSLAGQKTETAFKALEYGAVEVIHKPALGTKQMLVESSTLICDVVVAASRTKTKTKKISGTAETSLVQPKLSADVIIAKAKPDAVLQTTEKVVAVGASTGGTEALKDLSGGPAQGLPGHRHRAAHARGIYLGLFQNGSTRSVRSP